MSLPRYAEYKESEVEWLGQVPMDWRVDRLKASITSCRNGIWGGDPTGDADDIECVRVADFDRVRLVVDGHVPTLRSVTQKERADRLLKAGDLLLEKSGGGEKQPVGQVVLYDRATQAICSNFVAKITLAPGMGPRFWMYQHAAAYARGVNVGSIKQTSGIQNLDQSQYFNERGVFPSENEQSAIAAFLDRETGKIDALIAEQEKLLTLLAEKRQATISHAVTRGLNPHVPMKDSGVPWLGEVPEDWTVCAVKRMTTVITDGAHISPETDGGIYDFVSTKDVSDSGIDFESSLKTSASSYEYLVRNGCKPKLGDVLFSKDGTIGRTVVVEEEREFVVASSLIIMRPDATLLDGLFLHYLCQSFVVRQQVDGFVKGAGLPRLSIQNLTKVLGVFPSLPEQHGIAQFLEVADNKWSALKTNAERAIALLKERRSAMIAAAVTGKIDVRQVA